MKQITLVSLGLILYFMPLFAQRAVIQFNTPLSATPTISKAALRYDKDFAYSFTLDDGNLSAFTCGYPALMGGKVQGVNYSGLYFTDGCGNNIPFKAGLAWNAANIYGSDSHDGQTPDKMTWAQLDSLYSLGWDVFSHSFTHKAKVLYPNMSYDDYVNEVLNNRAAIKNKTQNRIETPAFVVPSGDTTYHNIAYSKGESIVFDQSGDVIGMGGVNVTSNFLTNGRTVFRQDLELVMTNGGDNMGRVAANASSTNNIWYNEFAHNLANFNTNAGFNFYKFRSYMERIANTWGKGGTDRVWMAPLQEVYEYMVMRNFAHYTASVNGNQLILDFDLNNIPTWLRRKTLTLVVNNAADFSSIDVPRNVKVTFRGTGARKIINFEFLDNGILTNTCSTDTQAPTFTQCPSNIHLTTTNAAAVATWTAPTASDNCTATPSVTSNFNAETTFPLGTTTVIYTAKDNNNNSSTCKFTVNVTQSIIDICTSPATNIKTAANALTITGIRTSAAIVQVFDANWHSVYFQKISTDSVSVSNLMAGFYNVKVTLLKAGGIWPEECAVEINNISVPLGSNSCTVDTIPPVLTACPADIRLLTLGRTAVANWTAPRVIDNCTTTPSVTSNFNTGTPFPLGTTTVVYTAKDLKNNITTCSFKVIVTRTADTTCQILGSCSPNSDLALSLTADVTNYQPYTGVNYTIFLENKGTIAANNIKVTMPFPANVARAGEAIPTVGKWLEFCPGNIACYEWTIPSLNAQSSANLIVPLFMNETIAPVFVTTSLLSSSPVDSTLNNNSASLTLLIAPTRPQQLNQNKPKPNQYIPIVIQSVSPNPSDGDLIIELESIIEKDIRFDFYNTLGKIDKSETRHVSKGKSRILFDFERAQSGVYFIQTSERQGRNVPLKFVKL